MGRRKAAPQKAPTTLPEAITCLTRYLVIEHTIAQAGADADISIATIEATRDELIAPLQVELDDIFLQLRAWWAVAGNEMAKGKKSIDLAGAKIGQRMTPVKLKRPKGLKTDADAVPLIEAIVNDFPGAACLLRRTVKLEKKAIVKMLGSTAVGPINQRVREAGFTTVQGDEFFIDRAAPKEPDPAIVDTAAPAIAEVAS